MPVLALLVSVIALVTQAALVGFGFAVGVFGAVALSNRITK